MSNKDFTLVLKNKLPSEDKLDEFYLEQKIINRHILIYNSLFYAYNNYNRDDIHKLYEYMVKKLSLVGCSADSQLSPFTQCLYHNLEDVSIYKSINKILKLYIIDIIREIVNWRDCSETSLALYNTFKIMEVTVRDLKEIEKLMNLADSNENFNENARDYLREFLSNFTEEVEEPDYLVVKPDELIEFTPPDIKVMSTLLEFSGINVEEYSNLDSLYDINNIKQKYYQSMSEFLISDILLFRLYGPCNSDDQFDTDCAKYGGHRMLNCNCFEIIEINSYIDEDEIIDWYTGNCYNCLLKIPKREWCVRLPLATGGWRYCFCSFDCIRKYQQHVLKKLNGDKPYLNEKLETNEIIVDHYELEINKYGIYI